MMELTFKFEYNFQLSQKRTLVKIERKMSKLTVIILLILFFFEKKAKFSFLYFFTLRSYNHILIAYDGVTFKFE